MTYHSRTFQGIFKDLHRNLRSFQERIKAFSKTLPTIQGLFKTANPVTVSATIQNFRLDFKWFFRKMSPLPFSRSLISYPDLPRPRERTFQRKTEWDLDTKLHATSKRIERIWDQTRETSSLQMVPCNIIFTWKRKWNTRFAAFKIKMNQSEREKNQAKRTNTLTQLIKMFITYHNDFNTPFSYTRLLVSVPLWF